MEFSLLPMRKEAQGGQAPSTRSHMDWTGELRLFSKGSWHASGEWSVGISRRRSDV